MYNSIQKDRMYFVLGIIVLSATIPADISIAMEDQIDDRSIALSIASKPNIKILAQQKKPEVEKRVNPSKRPKLLESKGNNHKAKKSTLYKIIELFRRSKAKGSSRTGRSEESCFSLANPLKQPWQSWSDRPSFIWSGTPVEIGIRTKDQVIWRHLITENEQSIQYNGPIPLVRGQAYTYWIQYKPFNGKERGYQVPFKVMSTNEYQNILQNLIQYDSDTYYLSENLDLMILERSHYFAQQGLFLDSLRELLIVTKRSPEFNNQLSKLKCILSPRI